MPAYFFGILLLNQKSKLIPYTAAFYPILWLMPAYFFGILLLNQKSKLIPYSEI